MHWDLNTKQVGVQWQDEHELQVVVSCKTNKKGGQIVHGSWTTTSYNS